MTLWVILCSSIIEGRQFGAHYAACFFEKCEDYCRNDFTSQVSSVSLSSVENTLLVRRRRAEPTVGRSGFAPAANLPVVMSFWMSRLNDCVPLTASHDSRATSFSIIPVF